MKISQNHPNRRAYNWLMYELGDLYVEKNSRYLKGVVIDLGCGEAPYKEYIQSLKKVKKYIGVDWKKYNENVDVVSDLNQKIDLPDNSVNSAISFSVMEHLYDPITFLKETNRILKTGGYFLLQVPWQWWIHEEPFDFYRYTPYSLKMLLEKNGFKIVSLEAQSGFFSMMSMKFNYFSLRYTQKSKIFFI